MGSSHVCSTWGWITLFIDRFWFQLEGNSSRNEVVSEAMLFKVKKRSKYETCSQERREDQRVCVSSTDLVSLIWLLELVLIDKMYSIRGSSWPWIQGYSGGITRLGVGGFRPADKRLFSVHMFCLCRNGSRVKCWCDRKLCLSFLLFTWVRVYWTSQPFNLLSCYVY